VLTNPERRSRYDFNGAIDAQIALYTFQEMIHYLFGSGTFEDCFGTVSLALMYDPRISMLPDFDRERAFRNSQIERAQNLAFRLRTKIIPGFSMTELQYREYLRNDTKLKAFTPGGAELLIILGTIYKSEAKKVSSKHLGLNSFWQEVREGMHSLKESIKVNVAALELQNSVWDSNLRSQSILASEKLQRKILDKGAGTLWMLGKLEIEGVVRESCQNVIYNEPDVRNREMAARVIGWLGSYYKHIGKSALEIIQEEMRLVVPSYTPSLSSAQYAPSQQTTYTTTTTAIPNPTQYSSTPMSQTTYTTTTTTTTPAPMMQSAPTEVPIQPGSPLQQVDPRGSISIHPPTYAS